MTEHQWMKILDDDDFVITKLAYADWLEEGGDELRTKVVRYIIKKGWEPANVLNHQEHPAWCWFNLGPNCSWFKQAVKNEPESYKYCLPGNIFSKLQDIHKCEVHTSREEKYRSTESGLGYLTKSKAYQDLINAIVINLREEKNYDG